MAPALLVSEQRTNWGAVEPLPSAVAGWDETITQRVRSVSPPLQWENWSIHPTSSLISSPFEYQSAVTNAEWIPSAKSRLPERNNPKNAELALEQIRSLHRRQEARRRDQEEAKWIATNRGRFAGHWVALLGGNLIAAGDSAKAVAQAASGVPSAPLIIYIENELPFAGW